MSLCCGTVCGGGVREGTMALAPLSAGSQSLPPVTTIKLGPSSADSRVCGFVYVIGPCGCLQRTLLWGWEFLLLAPQPPQVFSVTGFEVLFLCAGSLGCAVCLAPQLFLLFYLHANVGLPSLRSPTLTTQVLQPPPCRKSSLPSCPSLPLLPVWMSVSSFISLVVGLPYSSIFCQFWLFWFLFLNLLSFWLCEEAQCVYLRLYLGRK